MIHPTARVSSDSCIGADVSIGAFCVIGEDRPELEPVRIGNGSIIRSHSVVYRGTTIGENVQLGHGALLRELCVIGSRVSIGSHTVLEHRVVLGDGVRLHSGCFVPEYSVLEEGAWLGPGVIVTNARYPNRPDTKENLEGVHIERGATVGAGCVLLPGVCIGEGALIGAGAFVVRDVPRGSKVVGNPGRVR